jgi:signal transduction histidine kinase
MRQRVKEFGGELQLQNTNPGTQVKITIPANAMTVQAAVTHVGVQRS